MPSTSALKRSKGKRNEGETLGIDLTRCSLQHTEENDEDSRRQKTNKQTKPTPPTL